MDCPFCKLDNREIIYENQFAVAFYDIYPVTDKHILIIPKRHIKTIFDANIQEVIDMWDLVKVVKAIALDKDETITGYNIGVNCGEDAGQTVPHCHIHLIPRRKGDMEDPTGGVRGVIPEKQKYERR